jgi:hypothetical protein
MPETIKPGGTAIKLHMVICLFSIINGTSGTGLAFTFFSLLRQVAFNQLLGRITRVHKYHEPGNIDGISDISRVIRHFIIHTWLAYC